MPEVPGARIEPAGLRFSDNVTQPFLADFLRDELHVEEIADVHNLCDDAVVFKHLVPDGFPPEVLFFSIAPVCSLLTLFGPVRYSRQRGHISQAGRQGERGIRTLGGF